MALLDYGTALNLTPYSPFYMYRALEALCNHYGEWEKMHQALGTNECAIKTLIKKYADKIRHAKPLDEEEFGESYLKYYHALKYVRDTLLAFLIRNSEPELNMQMPDLSSTRIPQPME